ncbi:MAG: PTS sugar transporter subunit IIA [Synergistaceae bacterium]|jgi:PTS system galactitol-specific IIA component|nr:PTS sugar transporter subunit IIA [Synergistaceae bacterium]
MLSLTAENVIINLEAQSREDVIRAIVDVMAANGCVSQDYCGDVAAREEKYPTGLPTDGVRVAIPHGFSCSYVLKPAIGFASLAKPVAFRNMADRDEELPVEIVFLLANTDADEQVNDLSRLMGIFSEGEALVRLREAKRAEDVVSIMGESLRTER